MSPGPRLLERPWTLSALLAAVVALFWLLRIWLPGVETGLLTSDVFLYYLPVYETLYGALLEGELPLWNPYQLCGIPRLASLQAGFFYPGHVLYLLLPVKVAFALTGWLHLTLAGAGMLALVRRLGLGAGSALVAALLLAVRGRYPGMVFFPNMLEAAAWLPLGAVAVVGIVREGRSRSVALLAGCTGLGLLAGYPQVSVYVVYCWGALLAALLVAERSALRGWGRGVALFAAGLALGVGLAAVQLVPGWELTAEGTRSAGTLTRWQQFPFGWYGPGLGDAIVRTLHAPFPLLVLSLGWTALVLIPAAAFARGRRVLAGAGALAAALVLLFALGPVTPFFDWIVQLPALAWFRFPRRSLFMLDFFAALVAAIGVAGLLRLAAPRLRSLAPASLAAWAPLVPALLVAVEVFSAEPNRESLFFAPGSLDVYRNERAIFAPVAESGERVWMRSVGIESPLPPKLATYFGMRSVGDYEPLNLRRQADYFTWLMEGQLDPKRGGRPYSGRLKHLTAPTYPGALAERVRLLDVAGVRWVIVSKLAAERGELADTIASRGWTPQPVPDPDFVLLRNPHALPRAYVVYDVRAAPEPAALMAAMSDPGFDPLASSFVEGEASASARPGAAARILRDDDTVVEVEAELAEPGMLVLSDSFYPGWRASSGDASLEIVPANHLFRGVRLPAGRHRIRFEYDPWTLPAGAAASLASLAGIGVLWRRARRSDSIRADD